MTSDFEFFFSGVTLAHDELCFWVAPQFLLLISLPLLHIFTLIPLGFDVFFVIIQQINLHVSLGFEVFFVIIQQINLHVYRLIRISSW